MTDPIPIRPGLTPVRDGGPIRFVQQGVYSVQYDEMGLLLDFDYLDVGASDIWAELTVYRSTKGFEGRLHRSRVNLLKGTTLREAIRALERRTDADGFGYDWPAMLEGAKDWVIDACRAGEPAVTLSEVSSEGIDPEPLCGPLCIGDGVEILFGDGGSLKSYTMLALAVSLVSGVSVIDGFTVREPKRVLYLDWEWEPRAHLRRLRQLTRSAVTGLRYMSCRMPLREERDRIRREIRQSKIDHLFIDSVALAAGGEPETAETAIRFFSTARELGLPILAAAHITKADTKAATDKPFGSAFWANTARSTWYLRRQDDPSHGAITVGLFNRKANSGPLAGALALTYRFEADGVMISRSELSDVPDLAERLPLHKRIVLAVTRQPKTYAELGEELETTSETVRKVVHRFEHLFSKITRTEDRVTAVALRTHDAS